MYVWRVFGYWPIGYLLILMTAFSLDESCERNISLFILKAALRLNFRLDLCLMYPPPSRYTSSHFYFFSYPVKKKKKKKTVLANLNPNSSTFFIIRVRKFSEFLSRYVRRILVIY